MLLMGLVGYVMNNCGVPREGMVLGLVLGSMAETELARALTLVHGDVSALLLQMVTRPIALILLILCALSLGHAIKTQYITPKAPLAEAGK
jgi:putative tricarboxylic transport membrane protein